MDQEYQKWLDSLKVGDKVYCTWGEQIEKITHITKGRQIQVSGIKYKNGSYRGNERWDTVHYIRPITQDLLNKIEHKHLSYKVKLLLSDNGVYALPLDKLRRISAILEESNAQK